MLTKLIGALVGVMLAGNAWAANVIEPTQPLAWDLARQVCEQAGGDNAICWMRHHPNEAYVLGIAKKALIECDKPDRNEAQCAEWGAYIKQRWGY